MAKKKTEKKGGTISKAAKSLLGDESSRRGASRLKSFTDWRGEGEDKPAKKKRKGSPGPSDRELAMYDDPTGRGIPPAEVIRMMAGGYKKRIPAVEIAVSSGEMEPLVGYAHGRGGGPEVGNIEHGKQDSKYNVDPKLRKRMSEEYEQPAFTKIMKPWVGKERADYPYLAKLRDEKLARWRELEDHVDEKRTKWHKKHTDKGKDTSKTKARAPKE